MKRLSTKLAWICRRALATACLGVAVCSTNVGLAQVGTPQYRSPQYQPARPTVSPYLNLLRNDTGPIPNYYSLVRPQLQQNAFNEQQQAFDQRQQQVNGQQQQQIQTLSQGMMELRPGSIRPTGTAGVFMNRSHYYPSPTNAGRR